MDSALAESPLGKKTLYISTYNPDLLFPISRAAKKKELGLDDITHYGTDIWNAYELSWLTPSGCPTVAIGVFSFQANSPNIIESKSLKLYLNSFNNSYFDSFTSVETTLVQDLSKASGAPVLVDLTPAHNIDDRPIKGHCIDQNYPCNTYSPVSPHFLKTNSSNIARETLYSHLLKSICPCTGQPDWGTVVIDYQGPKLDEESLLQYIVSFRECNEFAEQCVDRIFRDILVNCQPSELTVQTLYTRRGGIDLCPIRSTRKDLHTSFAPVVRQ